MDQQNPFSVPNPYKRGIRRKLVDIARPILDSTIGLDQCNDIYARIHETDCTGKHFSEVVLEMMGVSCSVSRQQIDSIPKTGPLVIVANHPFGGMEGLAMLAVIRRVRPDVKLMANFILGMIPELADSLITVDPFGGESARARNLSAMKDACRWLKSGGALGIFPAGEVSHLKLGRRPVISDGPWAENVGKLIQMTGADAQCMYFPGHNSMWFQLAGFIHPKLRTLMLPKEFLRIRNAPLPIQIGKPISHERLKRYDKPADLIGYLRVRTYILASKTQHHGKLHSKPGGEPQPIASAIDRHTLHADIRALPQDALLLTNGKHEVYGVKLAMDSSIMREIGRLRELTFREVGEGTGESCDVDRYDAWYHQLFIWNTEDREIVGAYRLGMSEEILATHGKKGFYTNELFRLRSKLLREISPAIELGRSFIQPRYQKNFNSLGLLWKGIGEILYRNPTYVRFFGAVSISNRYHSMSKTILLNYLQQNHLCEDFMPLVSPKKPPKFDKIRYWSQRENSIVAQELKDVDELIEEAEEGFSGIPVLIRQYLRLRCKFLGFNIDPEFGNSLDGLILMDILESPEAMSKYIGKERVKEILAANSKTK